MNRDEAKQLLPIIQAFAEGKETQFYSEVLEQWELLRNPNFSEHPSRYRIKPDPIVVKYRRYIWRTDTQKYYIAAAYFDVYNTNVKSIEGASSFVRWIDTNWITEEVEINHD